MRIGDIVTRTLLGVVLLPFRAFVEPRLMPAKPTRVKAQEPGQPSIPRRR